MMTAVRSTAALCAVLLLAPLAAPSSAFAQSDACASLLTSANTIINTSSRHTALRERTYRLENDRCRLDARLLGEPTFTPDFRGIVALPGGGRFSLDEEAGGVRRRLELEDDGRGGITAEYRVGRDTRPFDAAAQAWLADRLLLLYRRTGLAAAERAAWIARTGGAPALLAEAEQIQSSSARATLLTHALAQPGLDDAAIARMLRTSLPSSSSARTQILLIVADRRPLEGQVGEAYLDAVAATSSSSRQRELLERALQGGRAPRALVLRAVRVTGGMSSSSSQSTLLSRIAAEYAFDDALLAAWLGAVANISSSSGRRDALLELFTRQQLNERQLARALRVVGDISSSSAQGELLVRVARSRPLEGEARAAFVDVASSISSSSQRAQVFEALERGPSGRGSR